jgi:hypothetical protein
MHASADNSFSSNVASGQVSVCVLEFTAEVDKDVEAKLDKIFEDLSFEHAKPTKVCVMTVY